jgi:hypothetical protein
VKQPHIYGDTAKCRRALARYIKSGHELLEQAKGVRKRIAEVSEPEPRGDMLRLAIDRDWATHFRKWFSTTQQGMAPYLQEQFEDALPVLAAGLPPDRGKPRHAIGLDNGVPWLKNALDDLRELETALGGPIVERAKMSAATTDGMRWFNAPWLTHPWIAGIGSGLVVILIVWLVTR